MIFHDCVDDEFEIEIDASLPEARVHVTSYRGDLIASFDPDTAEKVGKYFITLAHRARGVEERRADVDESYWTEKMATAGAENVDADGREVLP